MPEFANTFNRAGLPFREESEAERENNRAMINAFFERFIEVVARGRRVPPERARAWATGEVFWGSQAMAQGQLTQASPQTMPSTRRVAFMRLFQLERNSNQC